MPHHAIRIALVVIALLGVGVAPADAENSTAPDTPGEVVAALKLGFKGEGLTDALARAEALKDRFTDKELQPVVRALGRAFKQSVKNYQLLALKTLATLGASGSYAQFSSLLRIPNSVKGLETRAVHLQAINSAGALQDAAALDDIQDLLPHRDTSFARAAIRALADFQKLEEKAKAKLLRHLLEYFDDLEDQAKGRDEEVKTRAAALVPELVGTLEKLTGEAGPKDADGWKQRLAAK